jgi:hypothetical protein
MFAKKEMNIEALEAVLRAVMGPDAIATFAAVYAYTDAIMQDAYDRGYADGADDNYVDEQAVFEDGFDAGSSWCTCCAERVAEGYPDDRETDAADRALANEIIEDMIYGGEPSMEQDDTFVPDEAFDDAFDRLVREQGGSTYLTSEDFREGRGC